jgi:uncharacterized protein YbjT (DUF2867 family)
MILVTGSSGTVGTEVVNELLAAGASVRAAYHTRLPQASGVQGVRVDLTTGEGMDEALDGVHALFLLMGGMSDQTAAEIRIVEAARRAGVSRLVKLSVFGAETEAYSFARIHRQVERAVEASGMSYTFLRPVSFMQNFLTYYGDTIRREDAFYLPCGTGREAHVDARDIARVAAQALTSPGHDGKGYDLTGPELLSYAEAAAKLSAVLGRTITYVDVTEADFKRSMLGAGLPADYVDNLLDLHRYIREGRGAVTSTAVKDVTGRDPISFDRFARDYASAWQA